MKLGTRIGLSLLAMAALLVIPTVYGILALREVSGIARLQTRDAEGAMVLGRIRYALAEVESWERIYAALAAQTPDERSNAAARVDEAVELGDLALGRFMGLGFERAGGVRERWDEMKGSVAEARALVEQGRVGAADQLRVESVIPAIDAVGQSLRPVFLELNQRGEEQIVRARDVAGAAYTTTFLASLIAVLLAVGVAAWLTRSILRPVGELRRGMAAVAGGELEPEVGISRSRPDELGDLARSFRTMTVQLAEFDRLKAEVVSIASHELKTPLSVIQGYVALLRDGVLGELSERQRETVVSIGGQSERLGKIIQQLLDVSRFEAGGGRLEPRDLEVRAFLQGLAESFEVLAGQNQIDFGLEVREQVPETIAADPDRLNEVFGNLISNAFKFTPPGGTIRLRAAPAGEGGVEVEVEDTGVGIPEEEISRVFEKFYQLENEAQPKSAGAGLGLAIARELVEAHGGTISAESEVGRGTTFRVTVPAEPPAPKTP
ncbi:MAG: ATP-binding protein [Longimicrobiaceae bacterium]